MFHSFAKSAFCVALCGSTLMQAAPVFAACDADSGSTRATLVELYTSEGCSSCPPADKALMQVGKQAGTRVVPLALHVDYWDSIGWKDPFAQPGFTKRQQWEVQANGHRTSFTPHFFVNGREVQDWHGDLEDRLHEKSGPAAARLRVRADGDGTNALKIGVKSNAAADRRLLLFVAVTESKLRSQVKAGENNGATLDHDYVVRNWIGPIDVQGAEASFDRVVELPKGVHGPINVVAFLQDPKTAEVLQAVDTGSCRPS